MKLDTVQTIKLEWLYKFGSEWELNQLSIATSKNHSVLNTIYIHVLHRVRGIL